MATIMFQKATRTRAKARVAIDGPSGAGKTYSSLVLATALANGGKIAVIDTERGSASLYSDKFNFDVLELDNFSPTVYTEAINAAGDAGYSVIVVDSLSHAWEGEGGALEMVDQAAIRQKGNSYTAWKDVTPLHRKMVDAILQSKAHVVVTMRSKMDYVQEKDSNNRTIIKKIGMAPIQRAGMEYEFTIVADMDIDHHIVLSKSRCDLMADKVTVKPDVKFWTPFVEWLNTGETKQVVQAPPTKPIYQQPAHDEPPADLHEEPPFDFEEYTAEKVVMLRYQPEQLRNRIQELARKYETTAWSDKQENLLPIVLSALFNGDDANRHALQYYLTGKQSVKEMTHGEKNALMKWMEITKGDDNKFYPSEMAIREANTALTAANVAAGQAALL